MLMLDMSHVEYGHIVVIAHTVFVEVRSQFQPHPWVDEYSISSIYTHLASIDLKSVCSMGNELGKNAGGVVCCEPSCLILKRA